MSGAHPSRISVLSNDDDCDAPDVILMIIMTIINIIINIMQCGSETARAITHHTAFKYSIV